MHKIILFVVFSLFSIVQTSHADDLKMLTGFQLKAGAIALEDFMGEEINMTNLQNYNVIINEKEAFYEVIFVPQIPPNGAGIRGGGNQYGKEVRYHIGKLENSIILKSYAR